MSGLAYLICVFQQVRKWKMLSRHHNDSKVNEAESEGHVICPWTMSPLLGSPVLLECCICNGPFITYGHEEAWQPRQRTQVSTQTNVSCKNVGVSDNKIYHTITTQSTLFKCNISQYFTVLVVKHRKHISGSIVCWTFCSFFFLLHSN